jgi:TRAP-type C4-dicarboxylate transport system permease small subunit
VKPRERLPVPDLLLVCLFGVILVIILLAVFFRYVVNRSLFWSDEIVRYLFVWFTLFGAALTLRDRRHIRVEYFVECMPPRLRRAVECAGLAVVLALSAFLVVAGFLWVWETRGATTPALGLPVSGVFYAALPVTSLFCVYFAWRRLKAGRYAELDVGQDPEAPE